MLKKKKNARPEYTAEQMAEWLGLLDDAKRAEVLKTLIAEQEQTSRERLKQENETRRQASDLRERYGGVYIIRGLAIALLAIVALCSTCVATTHIDDGHDSNCAAYVQKDPARSVQQAELASPGISCKTCDAVRGRVHQ